MKSFSATTRIELFYICSLDESQIIMLNENQTKKVHVIWAHVHKILENSNLQQQKAD